MAKLELPAELAMKRTVRFLFDCVFKDRRWGKWLELRYPDGLENKDGYYLTGLQLVVPFCHSKLLERLQPIRACKLWNSVCRRIGSSKIIEATRSKRAFTKAAGAALPSLPTHIRGMYALS